MVPKEVPKNIHPPPWPKPSVHAMWWPAALGILRWFLVEFPYWKYAEMERKVQNHGVLTSRNAIKSTESTVCDCVSWCSIPSRCKLLLRNPSKKWIGGSPCSLHTERWNWKTPWMKCRMLLLWNWGAKEIGRSIFAQPKRWISVGATAEGHAKKKK